jgi:flagellar hook-length control protein FliK
MMNAASPPAAQGAAAGFAAFLANIGQSGGGEAGGFDQLLADAPALPTLAIGGGQGESAETADEGAAPDAAADAATVEDLLAALLPAVAAPAAKPAAKAAPADTALAQNPPPALLATPKPAPAQPMTAALFAEPLQAAGSPDGGAAMTVLFTQTAADGAAGIGETAKTAIVATRTLDLSSDDVWIEQLARDIVAAKSDSGDISFRLMPRHLGRLDVAMRVEDGGVALRLDTQHEATAKIVTAAQVRLVDDLRQQGVRVAEAQVTCTPDETGRHSGQQGQGRASATPAAAHLIETATEAEPREEDRSTDRRGRFA